MSSTKVPCSCQLCQGRMVSRHIRRKHAELYTSRDAGPVSGLQESPREEPPDTEQSCDQLEGPSCDPPDHDLENQCPKKLKPNLYSQSYLYDEGIATTPLYEGAPVTVLQALVQFYTWFSEHPGISKEALSSMLSMQHHSILPPGNLLPDSYEAAMRVLEPFLLKSVVYHVCPNDCIIFRGSYAHLTECPQCCSGRYIPGTSTPVRTFTYLPLGPRFARLFGVTNLAQLIQNHSGGEQHSEMHDLHGSSTWARAYSAEGLFEGDKRGLSLALCADGVSPFNHNRVSYSMWPIMFTILNLPRNIRNHFSNILLVGIIPGNGSKEAKSLTPYFDIVVDELLELSGSTLFDTYQNAPFTCKVELLMYVLDYPGICKVFSIVGSGGYKGCAWCDIDGQRSEVLTKMVYLDNRRYLPPDSQLRRDTTEFCDKKVEDRDQPAAKSYSTMKCYHLAYDNAENRSQAGLTAKSTGCKGRYALMRLPNHDRLEQTVPDAMHTIKDVVEGIYHLITGRDDTAKVRRSEALYGRFGLCSTNQSHLDPRSGDTVPYRLSSTEVKVAEERTHHLLVPAHLDINPIHLFSNSSRLKSHDWKQIATHGILKYCLRGFLGEQQRQTLFLFLDTLAEVLSERHKCEALPKLREKMNVALALLERDFPVALQDITTHLLHHIVEGIQRFGPVYGTWMFPFERFNSWMCRRAMNRFRPEATIMETYRIYEWCQFMEISGRAAADHPLLNQSITDSTSNVAMHTHLQQDDIQSVEEEYKRLYPQYKQLMSEYDKSHQRALTARSGSSFPSREDWNPPGRVLTSPEKEMLCGLSDSVVSKKRASVKDPCTGRTIEYTTVKSERSHKSCSSFVQILHTRNAHASCGNPVVGQIVHIFEHSFLGHTHSFAQVSVFHVTQDESSLWCITDTSATHCIIVHLDALSKPLLIAKSQSIVWVLDL